MILKNVISIDPGDHTGWSYWDGNIHPVTGQFNVKKCDIVEDELSLQWQRFNVLLKRYLPGIVYIEGVEFWEGSLKSVTAARRQNLSKLSYLVGGYCQTARSMNIEYRILPARTWKGQMSNKILEAKVLRINGEQYPSEHILNAVGIGFSVMGYFLRTKSQPKRFLKNKRRELQW